MAATIERIRLKTVCEILGRKPTSVRGIAAKGWITPLNPPELSGRGSPLIFDRGEVESFLRGGCDAARAYRSLHKGTFAAHRRRRGFD